mgnify:CR=1 FL=1
MYRNFIFDLYGTLVDIHTNEYKPSLWKKMALFYSFQGAAYTGKELRCRYRQLETAARKAPSPYAYPEICAADIFRILYAEKGIQPSESLLTATGQFFRIDLKGHVLGHGFRVCGKGEGLPVVMAFRERLARVQDSRLKGFLIDRFRPIDQGPILLAAEVPFLVSVLGIPVTAAFISNIFHL